MDTDLLISLSWGKSRSVINEDRINILGVERVGTSPLAYESTLVFTPLSMDSDDQGKYSCSASVSPAAFLQTPPTTTVSRSVTIDSKNLRVESDQVLEEILAVLMICSYQLL